MELTLPQIRAELSQIVVAMTAKGLRMPDAQYSMEADKNDRIILKHAGHTSRWADDWSYHDDFDAARAWVDALPSPEAKVLADYNAKISDAINFATENSLPDEYVTPLRGVRAVIYDALLPAPQPGGAAADARAV